MCKKQKTLLAVISIFAAFLIITFLSVFTLRAAHIREGCNGVDGEFNYSCEGVDKICLTINGQIPEEDIICIGNKRVRPTIHDPNL